MAVVKEDKLWKANLNPKSSLQHSSGLWEVRLLLRRHYWEPELRKGLGDDLAKYPEGGC